MNQRLIRLRKKMKLNQRELAKLSGVPFWRIAYAESKYRKLEPDQIESIKRVLEPQKAPGKKTRAA